MSTSSIRRVICETLVASAIAAVLALALAPTDPEHAMLPFHPAWIVALVLVARYGARGLYSVPAVVLGLEAAAWIAGTSDVSVVARLSNPNELLLLFVIAVVAAVGASHRRRALELQERLDDAEKRATTAEHAIADLCESALALRERYDRTQTSYAFLADLARRLDDPHPTSVGDAVLALAMARTGARGGFVQVLDDGRFHTLCSRGKWGAEQIEPPALFRDRVVNAAIERVRSVAAHELVAVSIDDSDLATPLTDSRGSVVGVLALRGIAPSVLGATARDDLAAVGRWAGRALEPSVRGTAPRRSRGDVRATV